MYDQHLILNIQIIQDKEKEQAQMKKKMKKLQ